MTLTSKKLNIIKTTKVTRIQPYLIVSGQFGFMLIRGGYQEVRPISGFDKYLLKVICANFGDFLQK